MTDPAPEINGDEASSEVVAKIVIGDTMDEESVVLEDCNSTGNDEHEVSGQDEISVAYDITTTEMEQAVINETKY